MRQIALLARWLDGPRATRRVLIIGTLLVMPSLAAGLALDDYFHRAMVEGRPELGITASATDVFRFVPNDERLPNAQLRRRGLLPWFGDGALRASFWRPLTSATHWLDYQLWPEMPALMHAQSLAWHLLLLLAAAALFHRLAGRRRWVVVLALLLYAFDDARGMTVGWLANRNALLATTSGVVALLLHLRWREQGQRTGAVAAPAMLLVGLLCGELAISATAFLFAYALWVDPAGRRRALLSLWPYLLVVVLWRVAYSAQGYGAQASGLYLDPLAQPLSFAGAMVERLPLLLASQLGPSVADYWPAITPLQRILLASYAVSLLLVLSLLLWRLLASDRLARFWASAMVLCALPLCATFPNDRLLAFVGLGASGLVARLVASVLPARPTPPTTRRGVRALALTLLVIHALLAPLLLPVRALAPALIARPLLTARASIPDGSAGQRLIVVNSPNIFFGPFLEMTRLIEGGKPFDQVHFLGSSVARTAVERVDRDTLRLQVGEGYLARPLDRLVRDPRRPFVVGQRIEVGSISAEVLELTARGLPRAVAFHFPTALEHRSLRWVVWQGRRFVPFVPPATGETVILPEIDLLALLLS